jgi:hypothetical protein
MATAAPDLTVKGEAVERVYGSYVERRYVVNRRYQRKLIWTLDEKREFIDSILRGYPVPIILLAESANRESNDLEIIDGMQRLDAIVSFIDNKYALDGAYFDLDAMAVTKELADLKVLEQKEPRLARGDCVKIASYFVPLSIYEFADEAAVDTVFRRINSGGRQLSRQELRSAGASGHFATVVRKLAAKVRGDDSASDILKLNEMQNISITNKELAYGIDVDEMFWVREGILARESVRKSQDEEIIADIVAYMVSDDPISSRTEFLDDFYGAGSDATSMSRYQDIETSVQKRTQELVIADFIRVLDEIKIMLARAQMSFDVLLFGQRDNPVPRYFQVVFLAMYDLLVKQNMAVAERDSLIGALRNSGAHINVQGGGGRWSADSRQKAVQATVGMLQNAFGPATEMDPAKILWITKLQNLLSQSYTEQSAYDFKQGFFELNGVPKFDEASFEKILKTLVAISNLGPKRIGYVLVGIAENQGTATRVEKLFGTSPTIYEKFWITGVGHEVQAMGKTHDEFFQLITDKVRNSNISEPLKGYIAANIKPIRYFDKVVYVFEARGMDDPSMYDNKYFERQGTQVIEVNPADFSQFFRRYNS